MPYTSFARSVACVSGLSSREDPDMPYTRDEEESDPFPDESDLRIVLSVGDDSMKMKSSFIIISTMRCL